MKNVDNKIIAFIEEMRAIDEEIIKLPRSRKRSKLILKRIQIQNHIRFLISEEKETS